MIFTFCHKLLKFSLHEQFFPFSQTLSYLDLEHSLFYSGMRRHHPYSIWDTESTLCPLTHVPRTYAHNHWIIESFELEGILKGHLVQLPCSEQGASTTRSGCSKPIPIKAVNNNTNNNNHINSTLFLEKQMLALQFTFSSKFLLKWIGSSSFLRHEI